MLRYTIFDSYTDDIILFDENDKEKINQSIKFWALNRPNSLITATTLGHDLVVRVVFKGKAIDFKGF